jgi:hypothetical protein
LPIASNPLYPPYSSDLASSHFVFSLVWPSQKSPPRTAIRACI